MKKKVIVFLVLLIGITGTGLAVIHQSERSGTPSVSGTAPEMALGQHHAVRVESVEVRSLKRNTTYPGTTRAKRNTQLAFRVGGPLVQVTVKPGDPVRAGQILMQIDRKDFNDGIQVLEAQLEGAMAQEKNAAQDLERGNRLFEEKVIPRADFDHATTAYKSARASVKQIRARLETARHQLAYTTLKAPYDGIITSQLIENHEMVRVGQVVLKLHDISELEISINVPENEILHHSMNRGEASIVTFPGLRDRTFPARLNEWNTEAERLTRTYEMTFLMPNPPDVRILPGMTAEVVWADQPEGTLEMTIPAGAVLTDNGHESMVWLFNPVSRTASKRVVIPGRLSGASRVCIKAGLNPGDLIVTQGMDYINPDMILTGIVPETWPAS